MRTRRSWRNQQRLWRELAGAPKRASVAPGETAEAAAARARKHLAGALSPRDRRHWLRELAQAEQRIAAMEAIAEE